MSGNRPLFLKMFKNTCHLMQKISWTNVLRCIIPLYLSLTIYSEAKERPTATVLLNHRFCEVDPNFNFAETKLGK